MEPYRSPINFLWNWKTKHVALDRSPFGTETFRVRASTTYPLSLTQNPLPTKILPLPPSLLAYSKQLERQLHPRRQDTPRMITNHYSHSSLLGCHIESSIDANFQNPMVWTYARCVFLILVTTDKNVKYCSNELNRANKFLLALELILHLYFLV